MKTFFRLLLILLVFFCKINLIFAQEKPIYTMKKNDCVVFEPKHSFENNSTHQNTENSANQVSMYRTVILFNENDINNEYNNNNNKLDVKKEAITNSKEYTKSKTEDILNEKK